MTDPSWTLDQVSLEVRPVIRHAADRLQQEFDGVFGTETIQRFIAESYDTFSRAKVQSFLPLFVERFTRERLRALAKVEGKVPSPVPTVVFLCVHNAGRSQMAAGWLRHLAGDRAEVFTGGSDPGREVHPVAVLAMAELGIDISDHYPKPWTDEVLRAADVVVTMGCGDACPIVPGTRYEDWPLRDPKDLPLTEVREIRDEIGERVQHLLADLGVPLRP